LQIPPAACCLRLDTPDDYASWLQRSRSVASNDLLIRKYRNQTSLINVAVK